MAGISYYKLFGLPMDATQEEIRAAYRRYQKKLHPDVAGAEMEELSKLVNEAYDTLKDETKRLIYDWELQKEESANSNATRTSDSTTQSTYTNTTQNSYTSSNAYKDSTTYNESYTYQNRENVHTETYSAKEAYKKFNNGHGQSAPNLNRGKDLNEYEKTQNYYLSLRHSLWYGFRNVLIGFVIWASVGWFGYALYNFVPAMTFSRDMHVPFKQALGIQMTAAFQEDCGYVFVNKALLFILAAILVVQIYFSIRIGFCSWQSKRLKKNKETQNSK